MKILITGISSEIVKKIASFIDTKKNEVIGISRHSESVDLKDIKIIKGDLLNIDLIHKHIIGCDLIIYGAAIINSRNEKEYFKFNYELTKKIVDLANKYKVDKFIFLSTTVAGEESGSYGYSKLLAEKYIQKVSNKYLIIRMSDLFGSNKNRGIDKLINDAITKSIILCPKDLPSRFYPIHIDDSSQIIFNLIFNEDILNTIKFVNGPKGYYYSDIIEEVIKITGRKINIIYISKKLLFLIMNALKIFPFNIGVVPDQIKRLYCNKEYGTVQYHFTDIETYIKNKLKVKIQ